VTQLWHGGIFSNHFVAKCPESVPVKEFWKSVNICQKYGQLQSGTFFRHSVVVALFMTSHYCACLLTDFCPLILVSELLNPYNTAGVKMHQKIS